MPTPRFAVPDARRAHDERSSRGAVGRAAGYRARWWLWGVLPYLWLALFSEAFHTHAPLNLAAVTSASTWGVASPSASVVGSQGAHKAHSEARRVAEALSCLACQWLACSAALLAAAAALALCVSLPVQAAGALLWLPARARRACSRGPPSSLMFAV